MKILRKYIGSKAFYASIIALVIPMIVQQGITNFVSLLDNVMVGGLGTASISAVAIVNQLIFVFNLTLFGGISGASIFGAQFFGKGDHQGLRQTFRFKMIFGAVVCVGAILLFLFCAEPLIGLFLHEGGGSAQDLETTLLRGKEYMFIMLFGLVPFMVVQTYAGTLRETGETVAPMVASILAILVNLVFNYLLIYGSLGFPRLGVAGAAIATVLSRYVEMLYVVLHTHRHPDKYPFIVGAYQSLYVPRSLVRRIVITGTPLLLNETLWSVGMTVINQSYSTRGLAAVAAINITSTAWQLFCVIMTAMGNAVAIVVGQHLGAGETEKAKDVDRKLIFMTVVLHLTMGALLILSAPLIPLLYNTEPEVRQLTTTLLRIAGASLPIHSFIHVAYFTIRSGGKTLITFFFDCVYTWAVPVTLAFCLCRFTDLSVVWVYFGVQFIDVVKMGIGALMLKSGFWAKNIIEEKGLETANGES